MKNKKSFAAPPDDCFDIHTSMVGKFKHVTLFTTNFEDFTPMRDLLEDQKQSEVLKDWKIRSIWKLERLKAVGKWGVKEWVEKYGALVVPALGLIVVLFLIIWTTNFTGENTEKVIGLANNAANNLKEIIDACTTVAPPRG